ncbi:MAG: VWA domain-containing protein [Promethearchaeota archaeon]|nr:MAG: VWA domain-containing protein [Candidatus Lokiarchaeota archaeon]
MEEIKRGKGRQFPKSGKKSKKRRYPPYFRRKKSSSSPFGNDAIFINYSEIDDYFNNNLDFTLNETDENCLLIGRDAWDGALHDFHTPAIPDPTFAFDKTKIIGFFIDLESWATMLNLSNAPTGLSDPKLYDFYNVLSLHEISHYVVCPYDAITNARLIRAALKHVDERLSPIVVNFFADLIVDMKLYRKKPKEMEFQLRETLKMSESIGKSKEDKEHSNFYKILIKCYELMWNIDLKLPNDQYLEITLDAEKISDIIMKDFEDETLWKKKTKQIAKILKKIIEVDFPKATIKQKAEVYEGVTTAPGAEGSKYPSLIPLDVQFVQVNPLEIKMGPKNPQNTNPWNRKDPDVEDVKNAEELANEMSLADFIKVNNVMGFVPKREVFATYYRGISKNLVEFKVMSKRPSGSIPIGIEPWVIGDQIEKLDILQSMLVSPKIIPNLTTRKWVYKDGPGIEVEKSIPDLMIVVDSSGSMDWTFGKGSKNKSAYHLAMIASFAALQYGIKKGVKIAAINFSETLIKQDWTTDPSLIEKVLLHYQGQGTELPTNDIKRMCRKGERNSLVLLITDFEIQNWEIAFQDIVEILSMGNKLVGFFIGGHKSLLNSPDFQELIGLGAIFHPISKIQDLVGLVIKEVQNVYNG